MNAKDDERAFRDRFQARYIAIAGPDVALNVIERPENGPWRRVIDAALFAIDSHLNALRGVCSLDDALAGSAGAENTEGSLSSQQQSQG